MVGALKEATVLLEISVKQLLHNVRYNEHFESSLLTIKVFLSHTTTQMTLL